MCQTFTAQTETVHANGAWTELQCVFLQKLINYFRKVKKGQYAERNKG